MGSLNRHRRIRDQSKCVENILGKQSLGSGSRIHRRMPRKEMVAKKIGRSLRRRCSFARQGWAIMAAGQRPSQRNERSAVSCSLETSFEKAFGCDAICWHVECSFVVDRLILNSLSIYARLCWLIMTGCNTSMEKQCTRQNTIVVLVMSFLSVVCCGGSPMNGGHGELPVLTSSDFPLLSKFTDILFKYKVQGILFWILGCNSS